MAKHARTDTEVEPEQAPDPELSPRMRKSRRMRRVLIVVIVLVFVALAALVALSVLWLQESSSVARQLADQDAQVASDIDADADDASDAGEQATQVPNLVEVLGMTQDEALEAIGLGAVVTRTAESEDGDAVTTSLTVSLADEPEDSSGGTPTVYLELDEDGAVVQAGYSVETSLLGYGSVSFADAVDNELIIQNTFELAGVSLDSDAVALPEDPADYTTYADDGTTVTQENCTFSDTVEVDGQELSWSARLQYDYSAANTSNNLSNTIRYVYVYVEAA